MNINIINSIMITTTTTNNNNNNNMITTCLSAESKKIAWADRQKDRKNEKGAIKQAGVTLLSYVYCL